MAEDDIDADLIGYANRRIPPARETMAATRPERDWVDGRWTVRDADFD